jgi:type VI secretion system protein ImpJ
MSTTTNRKHYDRVIWREGMLISPQHLQQQELFAEQTLHERLAASTPLSWGVQAIEFDAGALKSGRLELTRFDGVMPDGTDLRGKLNVPSRTIGDHFPTTAKQLEVSLGLPVLREGVSNFHEIDSEWKGRYLATTRSVGDISMSKNTRNLDVGSPAAVLLFGEEKDEDHIKLKIAEIVRDEDGSFTLSDSYIPPVLHIGASPVIMAGLREIMSLSVVKQRGALECRRVSSSETAAQILMRFHRSPGAILLKPCVIFIVPSCSGLSHWPAPGPWRSSLRGALAPSSRSSCAACRSAWRRWRSAARLMAPPSPGPLAWPPR